MNRRAFFLSTATLASGTIAGCLGSGDGNDDSNNSSNGESGAQESLSQATGTLVTVASRLGELTDPSVERTQSELDTLRSQLDDAGQSLSGIEQSLNGRVEAARTVLEFQRTLVDSHERGIEMARTLREQSPSEQVPSPTVESDGEFPFEQNRQRAAGAADSLQPTLDAVQRRQTTQDEVETVHESVDTGPLDVSGLDYGGDTAQYVRYGRTALGNLVRYLEAHVALFEGFAELFRGGTQFQNEAWGDARESFSAARETLQGAILDNPSGLNVVGQLGLESAGYVEINAIVSQAPAFRNQADELVGAAETAQNGNVEEARQQFQDLLSGSTAPGEA